jgi:hypothetical protein
MNYNETQNIYIYIYIYSYLFIIIIYVYMFIYLLPHNIMLWVIVLSVPECVEIVLLESSLTDLTAAPWTPLLLVFVKTAVVVI